MNLIQFQMKFPRSDSNIYLFSIHKKMYIIQNLNKQNNIYFKIVKIQYYTNMALIYLFYKKNEKHKIKIK